MLTGLEFTNLPLVEVAARFVFDSDALDLSLAKVLDLAQTVKERFPILEQPRSIDLGLGDKPPKLTMAMPIAIDFLGKTPGVKITIQRNLLKWSWTKVAGPQPSDYPRYPSIRDDLSWVALLVSGTLAKNELDVKAVNMGYSNFITLYDRSVKGSLGRYLSRLIPSAIMMNAPLLHEATLNWRTESGLDRKIQFVAAQKKAGEEGVDDGFILLTNIGAFVKPGVHPISVLDQVHLDLQDFFLDVISEQAKREWGYVERS